MATDTIDRDNGLKTWKNITWSRGERLPGARGKNKGILYTHRLNKRIKAELIADECAERERLRAEYVAEAGAHECPTCTSTMESIRIRLVVSRDDAGHVEKTVLCADPYHGKPKRKKRHKFIPANGGELMEKVL